MLEVDRLLSGVINLDKPAGHTSAALVGQVKRLIPKGVKIGHAGTLDRFATGVLLLLVGKATKSCEELMSSPKRYEAILKLGVTTATLDPEQPESAIIDPPRPDSATIRTALTSFMGEIHQTPPVFSALKVGGRRASDRAMAGEALDLPPRRVAVYGIELTDYAWPFLRLRIDCGRGFYVRALARDLGIALGSAGYLAQLRRTLVGPYRVENAVSIERLNEEGVAAHLNNPPD